MAGIKQIDLNLLRGESHPISVLDEVELPDFGSYCFAHPVGIDLEIRRVGSDLCVEGKTKLSYTGSCDRCLEDVEHHTGVEIKEQFPAIPTTDPFAEANVIADDFLNLSEFIRQVVNAALPLALLCNSDCRGLCVTCGANLNKGTCTCRDLTKGDHG